MCIDLYILLKKHALSVCLWHYSNYWLITFINHVGIEIKWLGIVTTNKLSYSIPRTFLFFYEGWFFLNYASLPKWSGKQCQIFTDQQPRPYGTTEATLALGQLKAPVARYTRSLIWTVSAALADHTASYVMFIVGHCGCVWLRVTNITLCGTETGLLSLSKSPITVCQ